MSGSRHSNNSEKSVKSRKSLKKKDERNNEYPVQLNSVLLKPLGLWPISYESEYFLERFLQYVLALASILLLSFVLISGTLFTFIIEKNVEVRIKLIGVMSFCLMGCLKFGSLLRQQRAIGDCLKHLLADWARFTKNEERRVIDRYTFWGRCGATIYACVIIGGGVFYAGILPRLLGTIELPDSNVTIRPLPAPGYFIFFDPQISPAYEIIYFAQTACIAIGDTVAAAACSLAVTLVMHACSQLEIIVSWLDNLVGDYNEESSDIEINMKLGIIIDHHVRTLRSFSFVSQTEKVLRDICLIDLLGSTLNLCLLGFDILAEWGHTGPVATFSYTLLIIPFLSNIFLYSYIGEMLTEKCQKIGEKTYMIDWYKLPNKTALSLTLTIATANKPATITAGKLTQFSMATFCSVVRTSVGYLNILRTLTM